jgi:hypothetical protein
MEGGIAMGRALVVVGALVVCLVTSSGTLFGQEDCVSVSLPSWELLPSTPFYSCFTFGIDAPSAIYIDMDWWAGPGPFETCEIGFQLFSETNSLVLAWSLTWWVGGEDAGRSTKQMGWGFLSPGEYLINTHSSCWAGVFFLSIYQIPWLDVDIIPQRVSPQGRGVIPVALLGSEDRDINGIDVTALRFGPYGAHCKHDLTDEWTYNEHVQDVNLDGYLDLMLHFETKDTGIVCGYTQAGLWGSMADRTPFEGFDTFETVGCNSNRPSRGMTDRNFERMQRK